MSSPLRAVLDAFEHGAATRADIARSTGLRDDVVDAALEHLIRLGRISAQEMATGCPGGGCGSCASGVDGAPGCGASAPSPTRRGPALVQLSVRR
jgi:hypothetical protein